MKNRIEQIRYYGNNDERNQPLNININNLSSGNIFNSYLPMVKLRITSSLPELRFKLNGSKTDIMVGQNGVYEIDVENLTEIYKLQFYNNQIKKIDEGNGYLIVDIVY